MLSGELTKKLGGRFQNAKLRWKNARFVQAVRRCRGGSAVMSAKFSVRKKKNRGAVFESSAMRRRSFRRAAILDIPTCALFEN